jgi:asparagine synthase (glutamine-hydrolysing)
VTATAARLLAPDNGRVVAFTAVPREGYDGPCPNNRLGDEGPLAAATAAMYPNVEHVLTRAAARSPLDEMDRDFFLFEAPLLNRCNMVWVRGINNAARERGLNVLLTGQMGNMGLSYGGFEFLPELLRAGRPLKLLNEALKLRRSASKKAIISHSLGPFFPAWLWQRINRFYGRTMDVFDYTAIRPQRLSELDLPRLAKERNLDLSYRPRVGAFESRMWVLGRIDMGNYQKACWPAGASISAIRPPTGACSNIACSCRWARSSPTDAFERSPAWPWRIGCRRRCCASGARGIRRSTGTRACTPRAAPSTGNWSGSRPAAARPGRWILIG